MALCKLLIVHEDDFFLSIKKNRQADIDKIFKLRMVIFLKKKLIAKND
jgi:hypothetical protein